MKQLYSGKQADYYGNVRHDLVGLLPVNAAQKVLEIGASGGYTLCYIKERGIAQEVAGVDLVGLPETQQASALIDKFTIGNIESESIELESDYYDAIICGDVLEHLVDPWAVVEKLSRSLKTGGVMIISVPNIREVKTLARIVLFGDFAYARQGILDETHLRFFCKKNALALATTRCLRPVAYHSSLDRLMVRSKKQIFNFVTCGLFKDFLTVQHLVIARKVS